MRSTNSRSMAIKYVTTPGIDHQDGFKLIWARLETAGPLGDMLDRRWQKRTVSTTAVSSVMKTGRPPIRLSLSLSAFLAQRCAHAALPTYVNCCLPPTPHILGITPPNLWPTFSSAGTKRSSPSPNNTVGRSDNVRRQSAKSKSGSVQWVGGLFFERILSGSR